MQTLSVCFLAEEMPEIREVVKELENVEILKECEVPNSNKLIDVTFFLSDPSVLYTMGLIAGIRRMEKRFNIPL